MTKRKVRILTGIAIVLVVMSLAYAIAVSVSAGKLHRVHAALREAGRPMHAYEVIPEDVPDTENAAPLYESAILLLESQPAEDENLLEHLSNLSAKLKDNSIESDERAELETLLGQDIVNEAISIVERGSHRSSCLFDRDYEAGMSILMPRLKELRDISRIIGAKAYFQAEAGHADVAWGLVITQLRVADALRNEPLLIGQLVRLASISLSCDTIQRVRELAPPSRQQTLDVESMLMSFDDITPMVLAIDGERLLFGEWLFALPKDELRKVVIDELGSPRSLFCVLTSKPIFLTDHAAYTQLMGDYAQSIQRPYSLDEIKALDERVEIACERRTHPITGCITPAVGRVIMLQTEMMARTRIARVGLALLRYKQASDGFPDTLDPLKLQDIDDPFSDSSLIYRTQTDGFVLYSVGKNQKDNGGVAKESGKDDEYDLVWRFPKETAGNKDQQPK